MYYMKNDIKIPNHNLSTPQKANYIVIVPKMRTVFRQNINLLNIAYIVI